MTSRARLLAFGLLVPSCFAPDAPAETVGAGTNQTESSGASTGVSTTLTTGPTQGSSGEGTTLSSTGPGDTDPTGTSPTDTDPTDTDPTDTEGGTDCGNGELDAGEDCDDGINDGGYGGCNADCTFAAFCGDGDVQEAEACDDGDEVEGDGCNTNCIESGTELWTHLFVTSANDRLDSPYFKEDGSVVVRASGSNTNEARTLDGLNGDVVDVLELSPDAAELLPWGEDDGFIVRESIGTGFVVPDLAVARYSEAGVEQWRREFEDQSSVDVSVFPTESVVFVSFGSPTPSSLEGDRVARFLDASGNEAWSEVVAVTNPIFAYDRVLAMPNGVSLVSDSVTAFAGIPNTVRRFNQGGGVTWTLEFETGLPTPILSLADGRWLARRGSSLQVRDNSGGVEQEADFPDLVIAFAAQAPNGDILVTGTGDESLPSMVARLSLGLEVLWQASPTDEKLPFFETTGLAVGPNNEVVVTADVFAVEAQGADGWAILLAP